MAPHPKTPLTHAFSHKCFFKHVRLLHTNSEGSNESNGENASIFAVKFIFYYKQYYNHNNKNILSY